MYFECNKRTLIKYLNYAQDAFLLFPIEIFSYSIKQRKLYLKKLYIVDNGFIKVIKQEEESVFIELIRKTEDLSSISYWKEYGKKNGKEVDFVVLKNNIPVKLIQVTYASDKAGINKREIEAIVKASKELNCEDALIITWDCEGEIVEDGFAIKCMPIWKWLIIPQI